MLNPNVTYGEATAQPESAALTRRKTIRTPACLHRERIGGGVEEEGNQRPAQYTVFPRQSSSHTHHRLAVAGKCHALPPSRMFIYRCAQNQYAGRQAGIEEGQRNSVVLSTPELETQEEGNVPQTRSWLREQVRSRQEPSLARSGLSKKRSALSSGRVWPRDIRNTIP